ncbi:MAG TPA: hypothetical protein VN716_03885 [Vicinamibacterales bacterium]|jgi:hypothetical protein|nr:hypothetical protein [Vicinamibacterales bacterium]
MKKNFLRCALLAALAVGLATPAFAGGLKLTMKDGRVTLIAEDVPLRQILQEWARVGQTRIINAEKLNGPSMTLQLIDTPERDALDILLRSASGYIAAPRAVAVANAAAYDRITIMATSKAPAASPMSASAPPPTFQRPPMPVVDDSDEPVVGVTMPAQPVMPQPQPMMQGQPMPFNPNGNNNNQVVVNPANLVPPGGFNPGNGQPPAAQGPMTAPRPGMVIPPAGQGGVPNPYQPTVVRPPGGGGPGGH